MKRFQPSRFVVAVFVISALSTVGFLIALATLSLEDSPRRSQIGTAACLPIFLGTCGLILNMVGVWVRSSTLFDGLRRLIKTINDYSVKVQKRIDTKLARLGEVIFPVIGFVFRTLFIVGLGIHVYSNLEQGVDVTQIPLAALTLGDLGNLLFKLFFGAWLAIWFFSFPDRDRLEAWGLGGSSLALLAGGAWFLSTYLPSAKP